MNDFIAGCIGGAIGTFVVYPFDTWRVRKQSIVSIKKNIFSGALMPMIGIGMEKSVVFGTHRITHNITHNEFLSGLVAGFFASFVVTPVEKWKIMKQNNPSYSYKDLFYISQNMRLRQMFNGLSACYMREVPGYAIYFTTYNALQNISLHHISQIIPQNDIVDIGFRGGMSGLTAWTVIYPTDTIKTHMQYYNTTFLDTTKELYKSGRLYSGFGMGLIRAFLLHSMVFNVYEYTKRIM